MYRWALVLAAILQVLGAACTPALHLVDSPARTFLRVGTGSEPLSAAGTTALLASLLGAATQHDLASRSSQQVDAILSPDVFKRPKVVLAVALAGVEDGDMQLAPDMFGLTPDEVSLHVEGAFSASGFLTALDDVLDTISDHARVKSLDSSGLPKQCDELCLESSIWFVAELAGFNYSQRKQPSMDCGPEAWCAFITRGGPGGPHVLDMMKLPDRLAALELAQMSSTVHHMLAGGAAKDLVTGKALLLETSLVGPQLLRNAYGADSQQFKAALQMTSRLLAELRSKLAHEADNSVLLQVVALGTVTLEPGAGAQELLQWRVQHRSKLMRRALLQDVRLVGLAGDRLSVAWATDSLAWLMTIVLILGIISAAMCICQMEFGQDTLLYARPKTE